MMVPRLLKAFVSLLLFLPATTPSLPPSVSPSVSSSSSPTTSEPSDSLDPTFSPSNAPSHSPTISAAPSVLPTISMAPTSVVESLCGDPDKYRDAGCASVDSWSTFRSIIEAGAPEVIVFCPITIQHESNEPVVLDRDVEIHCPSNSCVIFGSSTHLRVEGDTRVVVSGFTFTGSNQTAVQISTESYSSVTSFCKCSFNNNKRYDTGGGAMRTTEDTGVVNIVECMLYHNVGTIGGAILSRAFRLNIVSSNFTSNTATLWGGAVYMAWHAHLLARGSIFSRNRGDTENYSIVVLPNGSPGTGIQGTFVDAGDNLVADDGLCGGFFAQATAECHEFRALPAAPSLIYPYVPGELSVYDSETGLLLSSGLSARLLAKTGDPVTFGSTTAKQDLSSFPFHKEPDGAAVVPTKDGGWIYISNCEQSVQPTQGTGGVYALIFDGEGEIRDYRTLLSNTTRNCNGGLTPWSTWISCEETAGGQCWQVHPEGLRPPEPTSIGEPEGGSFEAFTYDVRNESRPCYFITEDHERGALRRWCPDSYLLQGDRWGQLHGNGTRDYLKFINGTNKFEWTPSLEEGRQSAQAFFPFTEGISHDGAGLLYFIATTSMALFACNLDTHEYRVQLTNETGSMFGDGVFSGAPDYVIHNRKDEDVLYFTEDGDWPGIHGLKRSAGEYFSIAEARHPKYEHDEMTGLAWSPDWTRLYVCIQVYGVLFEITRDDGLPFDHDVNQLQLSYHSKETKTKI